MAPHPTEDIGFYHLTHVGWVRQDDAPFPADRVESWSYQAECPADDANEQVCLRRIWKELHLSDLERDVLRNQFGLPVSPEIGRNVTLECEV